MDILITVVRTNPRGKAQRDQRRVAGPVLNIGRGSKSQIHLPDARVALNHARITVAGDEVTIEAIEASVEVNGRTIDSARLAVGDVIEIGPHEIKVETPPPGLPLSLTVSGSEKAAPGGMMRRVLLRAPRLSKRRLSYLAFLGVLLLALAVPFAADFFDDRQPAEPGSTREMLREIVPVVAGNFAQSWNPGPVSQGHQVFGKDCRACHQFAFLQVRDSACISCHKEIREHVPRADLTGPRGLTFAKQRCAECHRDHKGIQMAPRAQELCADCHVDVKAAAPGAQSENVTDFFKDHPRFRLSVLDADRPNEMRRVRQPPRPQVGEAPGPPPDGMTERSNLKFTHKLHLDRKGVRHPQKGYVVLECNACHTPEDGGRLMAPVTMERHCQECHSLAFEPDPSVRSRQVPHGSEQAVLNMLREVYARVVLGDVPPDVTPPADLPRMRPGAVVDYQERQEALRIADARAQRALRELYETGYEARGGTRHVCSLCHTVGRDATGSYKVAPVRVTKVWMPQARFTHAKHATERCSTCHEVSQSTKSADIAMPTVETCRDCHVGGRAVVGKVTSDCAICHTLHFGQDYWHKELQTQMQARGKK